MTARHFIRQIILISILAVSFSFCNIINEEKTIATFKGVVSNKSNPENVSFIGTLISDNVGNIISGATTHFDGDFYYQIDLSKLNSSNLFFSLKQHKQLKRIILTDSSKFIYSDSLIIKIGPARLFTKSEYKKYLNSLPKLPR